MDSERWERLRTLFDEALGCPESERTAFLERACGSDHELRDQLANLLEAHQTEGDTVFPRLDPPTLEVLPVKADRVGHRLGAFQVGEVIGRGGMSVVHRAQRQDADYEQTVAIKFLPPPSDPQGLAHRFRNEVRIQADLGRHPRIVGLIEAGTTPEGSPYVVMDYVDGQRVDSFCDQHRLEIPGRIRLFLQACEAVQYAHRHAVIHRDLKPSNILVDGDGNVHLIDFGIAKLLQENPDHDDGPRTQTGYAPMTPRYASPEQIRGEPLTTSSDVYALGLILYELLTGHQPTRSREPGVIDSETVPIRPSQAVLQPKTLPSRDGTTETLTPEELASVRNASPQVLRRVLGGDLDGIILTALRPEPERRYPSVEALVDDLNRHLNGEAVTARGDSMLYRLGVFVRRHRAAVAAGVLAVLCLIAGIVGTTTAMVYAFDERDRANNERDRANANLITARGAIDELTLVGEEVLLNQPHLTPIRKQIFDAALPYYQDLLKQADAAKTYEALAVVALAHERIGRIARSSGSMAEASITFDRAVDAARQALAEQPRSFDLRLMLASLLSGHCTSDFFMNDRPLPRIQADLREAQTLLRNLQAEQPESLEVRYWLAQTIFHSANLARIMGKPDEAIAQLNSAMNAYQNLLEIDPNFKRARNELAGSMYNLAILLNLRGDPESAIALQESVCALYREMGGDSLDQRGMIYDLGNALVTLVVFRRQADQLDQASRDLEEAASLLEQLVNDHPSIFVYQSKFVEVLILRAENAYDLNHPEEALQWAREAHDRAIALVEQGGGRRDDQTRLGHCYDILGTAARENGEIEEAIDAYSQGMTLLTSFPQPIASELYNASLMAIELAETHRDAGDLDAARQSLLEALNLRERLSSDEEIRGRVRDYRESLVEILGRLGELERDTGHFDRALTWLQRSADVGEGLLARDPQTVSLQNMKITYRTLGEVMLLNDQPESSRAAYLRAAELVLMMPAPEASKYYNMACHFALAASAAQRIDPSSKPTASADVDRALEALRAAVAQGWDDAESLRNDTDLDAIRDHPEFVEILQALESRSTDADRTD